MGLAILMAAEVKRYGVTMSDRIEEAGLSLGLSLMKAAGKLGRNRVWTGSTSFRKPLFFNMRRVQARFEREVMAVGEALDRHQLRQMVATEVGAPVHDVEMREGRLAASGFSLDTTQSAEGEGAQAAELVEPFPWLRAAARLVDCLDEGFE